jgi:hypothetical protein
MIPIIYSIYGLNLERMMHNRILYVAESSDVPHNYYSQIYHQFGELVQ